jgi:hypothetical protein
MDGQACVLRVSECTGGLCPEERIREMRAVYRLYPGWVDREGNPIGWNGFMPNLIAWRPATPQEQGRW